MAHPLEHQGIINSKIPWCDGKRVLDCGCGKGIHGYLLRSLKSDRDICIVGVDCAKFYLAFSKKFSVYDDLVLCDVRALPFRDGSFDIVLASEVLEHLPKKDGYAFLNSLKRLATERLIITTPNGFLSQEAIHGIQSERHISGWSTSDLKNLGFHVNGYGFKFAPPSHFMIYEFLDCIFTPISYVLPQVSKFLIAYAKGGFSLKAK